MDGCSGTQEEMMVGCAAAGTPVVCRWNPTKEQISLLENLYAQGLRTPSAEQIQEITTRLKTFGHIEGKNVFYWFQNHKARQRQKEKQDHQSLFRHYNHHHHHRLCQPPFLPLPPSPNVVYETRYIPPNNLGFYAQHPQVPSPRMSNRRSPRSVPNPKSPAAAGSMWRQEMESFVSVAGGNDKRMNRDQQHEIANGRSFRCQETLDLFPMHPTGILKGRIETSGTASCLASSTACSSSSPGSAVDRLYFDFLG